MKNKVQKYLHQLYTNISRPEMGVLPGHLAFYFIMMLIPLLTLLGAILSTFPITSQTITEIIHNNLPKNIADLIISLSNTEAINNIWIILVPTLILASNGTYSMIVTSNSIYKIKPRNYFLNRIKALFMMVVLVFIFVFLLLVPTFGNIIFRTIGSIITNENITGNIYYLMFTILKFPLTLLLVYLAVKVLYIMAPNKKVRGYEVSFGAGFTAIAWVIATIAYSFYIEYFSSYETFYGGISGLLFLMLWIFAISYIFVLGMALNASREEQNLEEEKLEKRENQEKIEETEKIKKETIK